jgi:hypothetical protein
MAGIYSGIKYFSGVSNSLVAGLYWSINFQRSFSSSAPPLL